MPRRSFPPSDAGALLDSWGRANRSLSDKLCAHCGAEFRPARASAAYCSVPCARKKNGGHNKKASGSWWINQAGYISGRVDGKHMKLHRLIAELVIGRQLLASEDVHHKNGDKLDNRPENLEVIDHGAHTNLHNARRTYKSGYRLALTEAEREARSERMKSMRREHLAKATGAAA